MKIVLFMQCCCMALSVFTCCAQEIKIYTGANLVMNGNVFLVVNNTAFKNNGSFAEGTGTVSFTGNTDTTTGYISGSNNTRFYNLTLNKSAYGIAVKTGVGVRNVLTVSAGKLYADSNLTLLSTATNTARLAAVPAGANVIGKAMVERYIPSRRAWRMMTAPVTNASTIYNTWQNGGVYSPGKGLLVSGPTASNGLDNSNATSLKVWNMASQGLVPVTNTNVPVSPTTNGSADNIGYVVFIRGDRNLNNFILPNSNVTTLTSIGSLQTGNQVFSASSIAGKYTLIGNPYASPIDFNAVSRTNLLKRFYVWDPTLNTLGGYVVLDDLDNDGVYSKSVAGSAQTKEIQSSQAFFVETNTGGSASLTIAESAKSVTNNLYVFRPASGTTESIRADLYLLDADNSLVLADGALAEYNSQFNAEVSNEDALKFTNTNENISLLRNGVALGIERRPLINSNDTLFLKLWKTTQRNYQLLLTPENMNYPGLMAFFQDRYLNTSTPVSLTNATPVNFTVDANAASFVSDRFRIVFRPATVLAVAFTAVKAYAFNENTEVEWNVQGQENTVRYEVERSADGVNFNLVKNAEKNNTGIYTWTDIHPLTGKNFYRIKSIELDGTTKYSTIVTVLFTKNNGNFTVEPNPVKGNIIQLHFTNQPKGNYGFNLFNNAGQLVYNHTSFINSSSTTILLNTYAILPPGIYQLKVTAPSNKTTIQKIIIQQ